MMRLLYISNFFNHHQKPLADELYEILGVDYTFVETWDGIPSEQLTLGYHTYNVPYVKRYSEEKERIDQMILDADVVIYGEAPLSLIKKRILSGKLTIRDDESRYKNPNRFLKWPVYTYNSLYLNKGYLLCASAYAPIDYMLSGMNPKKCFKWGYFTEVKRYSDIDSLMQNKSLRKYQKVNILWVGRLIALKHPEYIISVAKSLKNDGCNFSINVIGTGKFGNKLKSIISKENLVEYVSLLGPMPPENVRTYMEEADIFLFTSDRREGWGAVLNESMGSACAVVADGNIGSVPYLINHGVNGLIYNSKDVDDLVVKVKSLISNPSMIEEIGRRAYATMSETWNGEVAARNLIKLSSALLKGESSPISDGPCSPAPLIMRTFKGKFKTF